METGKRETGNVHAHTHDRLVFLAFLVGRVGLVRWKEKGGGRGITVGKI